MSTNRINAVLDPASKKILVQKPLPTINCIAIEGGGVRGAAYVGCFNILEKYGLLREVKYVSGSSVGAISALFLALGFEMEEACKELYSIPMDQFLEGSQSWSWTPALLSFARQFLSILSNQDLSLSSGNELYAWIAKQVKKKLGSETATFRDLANAIEKQSNSETATPLRELFVTGTNISLSLPECEIFSHETTPDMPIALAIRISSSYPCVFKAVEWKGHKYMDGGIIKNLPTKIFDERRFLPEGYDFTDRGVNPGVLALKIDSREEIEQVLWGVRHEVSVKTKSEIGAAIYNAASQTIDTDEMRHGRMVIALLDQNIQALSFTIDEDGKVNLVTSAEKVTQEFLENHIETAYAVEVYDSIESWLASRSQDELDDMLVAYDRMRHELLSGVSQIKDDAPTVSELQERMTFLKGYSDYRRLNKMHPSLKVQLTYPENHINLKPVISDSRWDRRLKNEMEKRLTIVSKYAQSVKEKINHHLRGVEDISEEEIKRKLRIDAYFDHIKLLTGMAEYLKLLEEEKHDLELKLGRPLSSVQLYKVNPDFYLAAAKTIEAYGKRASLSYPLKAVVQHIDRYQPTFIFRSSNEADNVLFSMDLRNDYDAKLFLIAGMLYLQHRRSADTFVFHELFRHYSEEAMDVPGNMNDLADILDQKGVELLVSAYRIEELINFFARTENPKQALLIHIDRLFEPVVYSFFSYQKPPATPESNAPEEGGIALQSIFKPSTRHLPMKMEEMRMNIVPSRDLLARTDPSIAAFFRK